MPVAQARGRIGGRPRKMTAITLKMVMAAMTAPSIGKQREIRPLQRLPPFCRSTRSTFANSPHELRAPAPMKCDRFCTKAGLEVEDSWCSEPAQQSDPDTCKHHSLSLPRSWEARKSEFDSLVSTPSRFSFHAGGTYGSDPSLLCWTRCA